MLRGGILDRTTFLGQGAPQKRTNMVSHPLAGCQQPIKKTRITWHCYAGFRKKAEATGFEPADPLPGHQFSKLALSTTQPRLQTHSA